MRNSSDSPVKPIEKHLYKHPLPKHQVFFCDTNFFIAAIIDDGTDRHKSAVKFLHRLSKVKTTLAFSTMVFYEVWNVILVRELSQALIGENIHRAIKEVKSYFCWKNSHEIPLVTSFVYPNCAQRC